MSEPILTLDDILLSKAERTCERAPYCSSLMKEATAQIRENDATIEGLRAVIAYERARHRGLQARLNAMEDMWRDELAFLRSLERLIPRDLPESPLEKIGRRIRQLETALYLLRNSRPASRVTSPHEAPSSLQAGATGGAAINSRSGSASFETEVIEREGQAA